MSYQFLEIDTMGTVGEMCVLVKFSPKRENLLGQIQQNLETEDSSQSIIKLDNLCATRQTVRGNCFQKIIDSYDSLIELWESTLRSGKVDTDVKSRIIGCLAQMKKFHFYYGLNLGRKFYGITDNLSKSLQNNKMSAVNGQKLAISMITMMEEMRNDRDAELMFSVVKKKGIFSRKN